MFISLLQLARDVQFHLWNNKEFRKERKREGRLANETTFHNYDNELTKTWQLVCKVDAARCSSSSHKMFLFLFRSFSCTLASLIGFYCLCNNVNHTLSVSTGDHVDASRRYMHPHMKRHAETHAQSLRAEDNTHRNLDGSDTNKHAPLAD